MIQVDDVINSNGQKWSEIHTKIVEDNDLPDSIVTPIGRVCPKHNKLTKMKLIDYFEAYLDSDYSLNFRVRYDTEDACDILQRIYFPHIDCFKNDSEAKLQISFKTLQSFNHDFQDDTFESKYITPEGKFRLAVVCHKNWNLKVKTKSKFEPFDICIVNFDPETEKFWPISRFENLQKFPEVFSRIETCSFVTAFQDGFNCVSTDDEVYRLTYHLYACINEANFDRKWARNIKPKDI